jgi:hypothetical protein
MRGILSQRASASPGPGYRPRMPPLARLLVGIGIALVVLGLALWLVPGLGWLGRLPGDLRIERPNLRVYVPLTSSILVSLVLCALFWVVSRLR